MPDIPLMPGGQPVLGHALEFGRDPLALFQRAREHGDVVRIRFGPLSVYVLNGADACYEDLDRLPFTRAVITEALRLYSPIWILPRRALVDVELGGHLLKAGSRIFFSPYALNRDPRLHRDPDQFDPGRWAADYRRSDLRATFFPFGQGIRNCIGEGFAWTESLLLLTRSRPAGSCGSRTAPTCTPWSAAPWCRASCRSS